MIRLLVNGVADQLACIHWWDETTCLFVSGSHYHLTYRLFAAGLNLADDKY